LGDAGVLRRTAEQLDIPARIVDWQPGGKIQPGTVPVYSLSALSAGNLHWGCPDKETGRAMGAYIEKGAALAMAGNLAGLVTCPITKKSLQAAGYAYPGHTEMLAALTGAGLCRMMMAGSRLKVTLVTIHEPLNRVPGLLTRERITETIRLTAASLKRDFALDSPRIAVAALNPHAGEEGMFGSEEQEIIRPAVSACAGSGDISGPWPPDTVFHRTVAGDFDAVIAMYHDQGLIPFKLLHFRDGVNVTLGLPIVRTSVDHGTAYDIAGRGVADSTSLEEAVALAGRIAYNRSRRES
jgi:4-hydroxythreonine-4-phosphate dehydrogenase